MSVPLQYLISSIGQNKILGSLNLFWGEREINRLNILDIFFFNFQIPALVGRCPLKNLTLKQNLYHCFVLFSAALQQKFCLKRC